MSETKLTDGQIIKGLEYHLSKRHPTLLFEYKGVYVSEYAILDLIHRLQSENERLKKFELHRIKKMKEQKAEIERLTEETTNISQSYIEVCDINGKLTEENAELQKQVGELKKNAHHWKSACEHIESETVKDTAKEIANWLPTTVNEDKNVLSRIIKERYGVEVE